MPDFSGLTHEQQWNVSFKGQRRVAPRTIETWTHPVTGAALDAPIIKTEPEYWQLSFWLPNGRQYQAKYSEPLSDIVAGGLVRFIQKGKPRLGGAPGEVVNQDCFFIADTSNKETLTRSLEMDAAYAAFKPPVIEEKK